MKCPSIRSILTKIIVTLNFTARQSTVSLFADQVRFETLRNMHMFPDISGWLKSVIIDSILGRCFVIRRNLDQRTSLSSGRYHRHRGVTRVVQVLTPASRWVSRDQGGCAGPQSSPEHPESGVSWILRLTQSPDHKIVLTNLSPNYLSAN